MTPAARLQAVIDILSEATPQPLDRQLKAWFRGHRFAGSADRRAITERIYAIFRHHAHFTHRMGAGAPRALVIASLLAENQNPEEYFSGGYGPQPLNDAERAAIAAESSPVPSWVEGEYPEWLEGELRRSFGERLPQEMRAFQRRAPVDLRVNTLKANRAEVLRALKRDGFAATALDLPDAIRCQSGAPLSAHPLYESGAFEIQDWAAQKSVVLAEARPGMRVLDLAAGAGGKALALAAAMQNQGSILAFDDKRDRLKPLAERAARAGANIITVAKARGGPLWGNGRFDLVFLDAPCSGTGTWRRHPELKWHLTPERLKELQGVQDWLLADAARHTRPGGQLVYATCSILMCENQDRVDAFLAAHPDFSRMAQDFHASPASTDSDGFYVAKLIRP
jgi:16S rRNA (cytosine967-C5)-methyltransferase